MMWVWFCLTNGHAHKKEYKQVTGFLDVGMEKEQNQFRGYLY